jgi:hypothetical protein
MSGNRRKPHQPSPGCPSNTSAAARAAAAVAVTTARLVHTDVYTSIGLECALRVRLSTWDGFVAAALGF